MRSAQRIRFRRPRPRRATGSRGRTAEAPKPQSSSRHERERARCCHVPGSAMCCSLGDHCEARVFVDQSPLPRGPPPGPAGIGPPCTALAREFLRYRRIVRLANKGGNMCGFIRSEMRWCVRLGLVASCRCARLYGRTQNRYAYTFWCRGQVHWSRARCECACLGPRL